MAESDPGRKHAAGRAAERQNFEAEEDPLVELARIVSEDSTFYGGGNAKAKPHREDPIDRNAFSADLEAELLQELESSFAARPVGRATPRAPEPRAPEPRMPEPHAPEPHATEPARGQVQPDEPDDLLQSIEQRIGEFERRAQQGPASQPAGEAERRDDGDGWAEAEPEEEVPEPSSVPSFAAAPLPEMRSQRTQPTDQRVEPSMEQPPAAAVHPDAREAPAPPPRRPFGEPAFPAATRVNAGRGGERIGSEPPRQRVVPAGFATASSWDEIAAEDSPATPPAVGGRASASAGEPYGLRTTFGDLGEADEPQPGDDADVGHFEAEMSGPMEPSYADPTFGGRWDEDGDEARPELEDEPRVAPALPGASHAPRAGRRRRGSGRGFMVGGALLAVLLAGAAAAYYLTGEDTAPSGAPPVIAAEDGPVKIAAEQPQQQAGGETPGEAVYDRVAGRPTEAEEQVVESAEEPREVSRIVLPQSRDESDALVRRVGEEAAASDDGSAGPRLVRTYVVRPDGTIVASDEAGASAAEEQVAAADLQPVQPIDPVAVPTTPLNAEGAPRTEPEETAPAVNESTPAAAVSAPEPAAIETPEPPAETIAAEETAAEETPAAATETDTAAAQPEADVQPPAEPEPQPAAEAEEGAPAELLSAAAEATPGAEAVAAPTAPAGTGYLVQLSSQRTEEQARASFADLQRRFGSVLGQLEADIQQADLGEKGIYYRVRVGPWATRGEAIEVCESLQAAGGSCFVAQ